MRCDAMAVGAGCDREMELDYITHSKGVNSFPVLHVGNCR